VLDSIAAGATQTEAARSCGVAPRTVASWMEKGRRDGDGRYHQFTAAVDEIRERCLHLQTGGDEPGDLADLMHVVWKAAQAGSVQAMRLYRDILDWIDEHDRDDEPNPLAGLLGPVEEGRRRGPQLRPR
jgi:hypothetical protein